MLRTRKGGWVGGLAIALVGCSSGPSLAPVASGGSGPTGNGATLAISSPTTYGRFRDSIIGRDPSGSSVSVKVPLKRGEHPFFEGAKNDPASLSLDARVEPNGTWSGLTMNEEGVDPRFASATLPGEYPSGSTLRLRLHNAKETSEALVKGLPATKTRFDLSGRPQERLQPVSGVTLDAVAYSPRSRRAGDAPTVGVLLRARLPQGPHQLWRLNDLGVETPFEPTVNPTSAKSTISRYRLDGPAPTYMEELSTAFADGFPRVRLTGDLERCETREETVDFGRVPIIIRGRAAYLCPKADLKRTLADGRVVTLHAPDPNERLGRPDPWTVGWLSVEGGAPWPGEDPQILVAMASHPRDGVEFRPNGGRTEVALYDAPPHGPLRLTFIRVRRAETLPIDLSPAVRKVDFKAFGSSHFGHNSYLGPADAARLALLPKD